MPFQGTVANAGMFSPDNAECDYLMLWSGARHAYGVRRYGGQALGRRRCLRAPLPSLAIMSPTRVARKDRLQPNAGENDL